MNEITENSSYLMASPYSEKNKKQNFFFKIASRKQSSKRAREKTAVNSAIKSITVKQKNKNKKH